jgi:hypothetical protein
MKSALIAGVLLFSTTSFAAGIGAGNGGQGIICKNGQGTIISVQVADYYEGLSTMPGTALDLGPATQSYMDIVKYVLARLSQIDPVAASRYLDRAQRFESELMFTTTPLSPIDDAHDPVEAQPGCSLAQFALQNYPVKPLQSKYIVDQNIWDGADAIAKAGLVLHEVIYTDALEDGQTTSDNTRYFNYLISSNRISGVGLGYIDILRAADLWKGGNSCDFSYVLVPGIPLCLNDNFTVRTNVNNAPISAYSGIPVNPIVSIDGATLSQVTSITCYKSLVGFILDSYCDFMNSFSVDSDHVADATVTINGLQILEDFRTPTSIYSNGHLRDGLLENNQSVQVPDGRKIRMYPGEIQLSPSEILEGGFIANPTTFQLPWGQTALFAARSRVLFDSSGTLSKNAELGEKTWLLAGGQKVLFDTNVINFNNSMVTSGVLAQETVFNSHENQLHLATGSWLQLNEDGSLLCTDKLSQPFTFQVQGQTLQAVPGSYSTGGFPLCSSGGTDIMFWPNGQVQTVFVSGGITLQVNGSKQKLKDFKLYGLRFDEKGNLTEAEEAPKMGQN